MRLEPELWDALAEICARERQDISRMVRHIEAIGHSGGRTSAVRVFVLKYFREAASEAGHEAANHGALDRVRSATTRVTPRRGFNHPLASTRLLPRLDRPGTRAAAGTPRHSPLGA